MRKRFLFFWSLWPNLRFKKKKTSLKPGCQISSIEGREAAGLQESQNLGQLNTVISSTWPTTSACVGLDWKSAASQPSMAHGLTLGVKSGNTSLSQCWRTYIVWCLQCLCRYKEDYVLLFRGYTATANTGCLIVAPNIYQSRLCWLVNTKKGQSSPPVAKIITLYTKEWENVNMITSGTQMPNSIMSFCRVDATVNGQSPHTTASLFLSHKQLQCSYGNTPV